MVKKLWGSRPLQSGIKEDTVMTIEQVKEEAKKRFDKELTDEQARAWLDAHPAGGLQDNELADVAGGGCGKSDIGEELHRAIKTSKDIDDFERRKKIFNEGVIMTTEQVKGKLL